MEEGPVRGRQLMSKGAAPRPAKNQWTVPFLFGGLIWRGAIPRPALTLLGDCKDPKDLKVATPY